MAISKPLLHSFFERIKYPQSQHPKDKLQFLSELQKFFIANIPFETLALHYSVDKNVSLEVADIYDKIVIRNRGGYCHELNTLMGAVLRALGFHSFAVVCRFWNSRAEPPQYRPISHMANIVTIDGVKYLVDVGCGVQGPCRPLPLVASTPSPGLPSQELKLEYRSLSRHLDENQRVWVYYQRWGQGPWEEIYNFAETEFFPADFEILNYYTIKCSPFSRMVLVQKFLKDDETDGLYGTLVLLDDKLNQKTEAGEVLVATLSSEEDRVAAFEKYFSIRLTMGERNAITTPIHHVAK